MLVDVRAWLIVGLLAVTLASCGDDEDTAGSGGGTTERSNAASRAKLQGIEEDLRVSAKRVSKRLQQLPAQSAAASGQGFLPSGGGGTPQTMDQFLTTAIEDVDRFWVEEFAKAKLPEPQIKYNWLPVGASGQSPCTNADGTPAQLNDESAFYCRVDDTITIAQQFAIDLWNGVLEGLGGQDAGAGRTVGDFGTAMVVAHEYGHNIQHELGLYKRVAETLPEGVTPPAKPFELQADCLSGIWASSVLAQGRLEQGDVQEALSTALAIGDFDLDPGRHHGTPQERYEAWNRGYTSGDGGQCASYLDASQLNVEAGGGDSGSGEIVIGPDGTPTVIVGGG